jgi:2-oxoglutarate ferredoxin oxidoreductase subunit gamma
MKILLAGEGGQGVQTVAKVITLAAQKSGKSSSYIPSFGVEQRGGVSLAYIQLDNQPVPYPRFEKSDILVVFCKRAIEPTKKFISDETLYIFDNSAIADEALEPIKSKVKKYIAVPAQKVAREKYSTKILNMVFLGVLANQLKEIGFQKVEDAVLKTLAEKIAKDPKIKDMNLNALHEGGQIADSFDPAKTLFKGASIKEPQREFSDAKKTWTRYPEYCKGCNLCIIRCPVKALSLSDEVGFLGNPMPKVDINKCIACSMCEKTCPDGAIRVEKK